MTRLQLFLGKRDHFGEKFRGSGILYFIGAGAMIAVAISRFS